MCKRDIMCDLDVKFSNLIVKFIFAMVIECIMHIWSVTYGLNELGIKFWMNRDVIKWMGDVMVVIAC